MTTGTAHHAVGTWVHYTGSLTHLTGQLMQVAAVNATTGRLILTTATGAQLRRVRRTSVRPCTPPCHCRPWNEEANR